jgi:hypothetical protein
MSALVPLPIPSQISIIGAEGVVALARLALAKYNDEVNDDKS